MRRKKNRNDYAGVIIDTHPYELLTYTRALQPEIQKSCWWQLTNDLYCLNVSRTMCCSLTALKFFLHMNEVVHHIIEHLWNMEIVLFADENRTTFTGEGWISIRDKEIVGIFSNATAITLKCFCIWDSCYLIDNDFLAT